MSDHLGSNSGFTAYYLQDLEQIYLALPITYKARTVMVTILAQRMDIKNFYTVNSLDDFSGITEWFTNILKNVRKYLN